MKLSQAIFAISIVTTQSAFAQIAECDLLASSPLDPQKQSAGVSFNKLDHIAAVPACKVAVTENKQAPRLWFQYGRSLEKAKKLPDSIIDASADLGAKPGRTFLKVILPITWPAIIAGSLFTFSLSLGDYITVQILGGTFQMLGNVVYQNFALNLPFAAAVALIPVIVMFIYLGSVRKTGALDNL